MANAHKRREAVRPLDLWSAVRNAGSPDLMLVWLLLAMVVAGCGDPGPATDRRPYRGPVVLVTVTGLRADAVGAFGGPAITPHLDGLISRAEWAGRAIAATSDPHAATASLLTGLQPWSHGVLGRSRARLSDELRTLPEAFVMAGYRTVGFLSSDLLEADLGYRQGLQEVRLLGDGELAGEYLRGLGQEPVLVWVELRLPTAPYRREDDVLSALGEIPEGFPERLSARFFERHFDPAVPWSEDLRRAGWALYLSNVARMDRVLGVVFGGLEDRVAAPPEPLVVLVSSRGEELGDYRQSLSGGSLGRALVEVPLIIDLPSSGTRAIAVDQQGPVAVARVAATLIDAVGGDILPAQLPSLFLEGDSGVLSELYLKNGYNEMSWYRDGRQLIRRSYFATSHPRYHAARRALLVGYQSDISRRSAVAIFRQLEDSFAEAPPLSGRRVEERLVVWGDGQVADERRLIAEMSQELERAWKARNGEDLPLELPRPGRADSGGG